MKVFDGRKEYQSSNIFHTVVALGIWLAAISLQRVPRLVRPYLPFVLQCACVVFALLVFLMVVPVYDKGKVGRALSRYICKHACNYFLVSLHVEGIDSFDPHRAYGVLYTDPEAYGHGWV